MTLPCQPVVQIRLGTGAGFGDVFVLGDLDDGILGENILGTTQSQVVDISSTVQRISIRRGRDRMFEQYSPGQGVVQFLDFTGDWNPDNSSSPYYGQILPMRQVKVSTTYQGTAYQLFTGFITSWDWSWADQSADYAIVTVQLIDAFRLLQLAEITSVTGAANKDLPGTRIGLILDQIDWPTMLRTIDTGDTELQNDPGSSRTSLSAIQNIESSDLGAFFADGDGYLTYLSRTSLAERAAGYWDPQPLRTNLSTNPSFETNTTSWSTFRATVARTAGTITGGQGSWSAVGTHNNTLNGGIFQSISNPVIGTSITGSIYCLRLSGSRSYRLAIEFYNGASFISQVTGTAQSCATSTRLTVTGTVPSTATSAVFTLYSTVTGSIGDQFQCDAFLVEQSSTANNYFDGDEYSPGGVYDAADTAWTGTPNASTSTCVEYDTDPITFNDDGTGVSYQQLDINLDETELANDVTITRLGGAAQQVTDATSIADYFRRSYSRDGLMMETNATALARATSILNYRKTPRLRVDSIGLDISSDSNRVTPALKLDIGDPIIVRRQMAAGTNFDLRITVNGISHDITPERWTTRFTTAYPLSTAFILGSTEFGILGTNTL